MTSKTVSRGGADREARSARAAGTACRHRRRGRASRERAAPRARPAAPTTAAARPITSGPRVPARARRRRGPVRARVPRPVRASRPRRAPPSPPAAARAPRAGASRPPCRASAAQASSPSARAVCLGRAGTIPGSSPKPDAVRSSCRRPRSSSCQSSGSSDATRSVCVAFSRVGPLSLRRRRSRWTRSSAPRCSLIASFRSAPFLPETAASCACRSRLPGLDQRPHLGGILVDELVQRPCRDRRLRQRRNRRRQLGILLLQRLRAGVTCRRELRQRQPVELLRLPDERFGHVH